MLSWEWEWPHGNGRDWKRQNHSHTPLTRRAVSLLLKDGWLDVTRRYCVKRLKISSHFCLGLLWLWFSNTALRNSNGKGSLWLGWKTLYDPTACWYVNTPSAYDTYGSTVASQLPILFLPPDDISSRRFLSISWASCFTLIFAVLLPRFKYRLPIYFGHVTYVCDSVTLYEISR